jgi:glycosyltransferase involved in cell wall biosynthesis
MNPMRKVLFVIDSFTPSGRASQVYHLALGLRRQGWPIGVCTVNRAPNGHADEFTSAGIWTWSLNRRLPFDFRCLNPLDNFHFALGKESPEIIHTWGLDSALHFALAVCRPSRLTASAALPAKTSSQWPARLLLRRVRRVIAIGESEAEGYRRLGVPADRLAVVPPGVPIPDTLPSPTTLPGLPDDARVVLCLGPVLRHKGHRESAWAFDILRLVHPNARLVIVGGGAELDSVRRFVRVARCEQYVHFTGPVADVSGWLSRASIVWVPSLLEGGRYSALEGMAAGRPVIASRLPGLSEIVEDGQTGYLIPPGDKPQLAHKTRLLLDHPDLAAQMGESGRRRVSERFSLSAHVAKMADVLGR